MVLSVILLAGGACQSPMLRTPSSALPRLQGLLTLQPFKTSCNTAQGLTVPCVLVKQSDFEAIVIELKAACLREGGSKERCGAE